MSEFFGSNFHKPMDGLKIVSRCPVCQTEHNPIETSILDEIDGAHLLYIKCRKCNSGVVASVAPSSLGVASLGVITDLSANEIQQAKDWGIVGEDDVLDAVKYFQNNKSV